MTPEETQKQAYREGQVCSTCPHCYHGKQQHTRWRECRQDDPTQCRAVIYSAKRKRF